MLDLSQTRIDKNPSLTETNRFLHGKSSPFTKPMGHVTPTVGGKLSTTARSSSQSKNPNIQTFKSTGPKGPAHVASAETAISESTLSESGTHSTRTSSVTGNTTVITITVYPNYTKTMMTNATVNLLTNEPS